MTGYDRSDDYQPLTYIGNYPVYVTTALVMLHTLAATTCCLLMGLHRTDFLENMMFSSAAVIGQFHVWQFLTYAFVHLPMSGDSIGPSLISFFIEMYFLLFIGRETERYLGRRTYLILYAALLLTPPAVLTLGGWMFHADLPRFGSAVIHLGIFVAFATIYPNISFFFGILAKWMAWAALAAYTLGSLAYGKWADLATLWACAGVAYVGMRQAGVGGGFSLLGNLRERFPRRTMPSGVKPRLKPRRTAVETLTLGGGSSAGAATGVLDVHESIDPLLDKISKHGLASLTAGERAVLERARVSLLRKERGG